MENQITNVSVLQCHEWLHKKHSSVIVLIKVGDFYETYDEDAVIVSKYCGIGTTKRADCLLCGFPANNIKTISTKLAQAGFKVMLSDYQDIVKLIKPEKTMERKSINLNSFKHIGNHYTETDQIYFWFNKQKGALEEVKIDSIVFDFVTGSIVYNLLHNGSTRMVEAKKDFESEFTLKLYMNEKHYMEQSSVVPDGELIVWRLISALKDCFNSQNRDGEYSFYGYALKNGEIVEVEALEYIKRVCVSFGNKKYSGAHYSVALSQELDFEHIYKKKDELAKFESIRIINNDGTETKTDAPLAILRLSDEQKKAVESFLAARRALKEAGVGIIFNSYDWDMYAVNIKEFESIESDEPNLEFDEYLQEGILRVDSLPKGMAIDFDFDGNFNDDCCSTMFKYKK